MAGLDQCGGAATQERLRRLLRPGADVTGLVDTTAAVAPGAVGQCLVAVAADQGVDSVLALAGPAAIASLRLLPALQVADAGKPLVLAAAGQPEAVRLLALRPGGSSAVPAYGSPAAAARALAHAARHGARRAPGHVPEFSDLRTDDARALIPEFLTRAPDGGWLPAAAASELLSYYGVRIAPARSSAVEEAGIEVKIAVEQEPVFGPLTVSGTGRISDVRSGDSAARAHAAHRD